LFESNGHHQLSKPYEAHLVLGRAINVVLDVPGVKMIDVNFWRYVMSTANNSAAITQVLQWLKSLAPWQFIILVIALLLGYLLK
jgi:hypothetical protein